MVDIETGATCHMYHGGGSRPKLLLLGWLLSNVELDSFMFLSLRCKARSSKMQVLLVFASAQTFGKHKNLAKILRPFRVNPRDSCLPARHRLDPTGLDLTSHRSHSKIADAPSLQLPQLCCCMG